MAASLTWDVQLTLKERCEWNNSPIPRIREALQVTDRRAGGSFAKEALTCGRVGRCWTVERSPYRVQVEGGEVQIMRGEKHIRPHHPLTLEKAERIVANMNSEWNADQDFAESRKAFYK